MKVAIACGGTGGHVFPGIAVGEVLEGRGHDVTFWLCGKDVEKSATPGIGKVQTVAARSFSGGLFASAPGVVSLLRAFLDCRRRMTGARPDVILGMGSYASVAPVLAARTLGVPVVMHEANAIPGRAVSLLSRFASAVGISFPHASERLRNCTTVLTGLPVRAELSAPPGTAASAVSTGPFTVLVMGGSQGAQRINEVASAALCALQARGTGLQVIHLTGRADEERVRNKYLAAGMDHEVSAFRSDMRAVYDACDLAVCRAGAATCAELAVRAVPGILIPLPWATRNHQLANAMAMQGQAAACVMPQAELNEKRLADCIADFADKPEKLDAMKDALQNMAIHDGAARLADLVESVAGEGM